MDLKKRERIVISLAVILFLGFILFVKTSIAGYIIYTPNNYNYNLSLINLSDNELKLIPVITNTTTITPSFVQISAAIQDGEDKLSIANSLDNNAVEIKDKDAKVLDLVFASNLENNDIVSAYLIDDKITGIKICQPSSLCSDHYANLDYDGNPKYLNFTLNLSSERDSFGIFPTIEKIMIDHIYATHFTTNTSTNLSYPFLGIIETDDIEPENVSKFEYFNYTHTLNNQSIEYYYSTDSGNNWINITDQNISTLNLTKIKIKAVLHSDGVSTPLVNSLSLFYSEINSGNESQNNPENPGTESSGSATSTSSSEISDRAPSSSAPNSETTVIQNIQQKEEPKEIELIEELKKQEGPTDGELITAEVVKEVETSNYWVSYLFIALITAVCLIYYRQEKIKF